MFEPRRIYVDLDDVLSETARALIGLLEKHFGKTVAFDQIFSFDLGQSFDLNEGELQRFMELAHEPDILASLEPVCGAARALDAFISLGYQIAIITGRPPGTAAATREWLKGHFIPYHDLVFVDKYGRGGFEWSYPTVITLGELSVMTFCFAVEDSSDMAVFLATEIGVPVALLDRPWNWGLPVRGSKALVRIERHADWDEILTRFVSHRARA